MSRRSKNCLSTAASSSISLCWRRVSPSAIRPLAARTSSCNYEGQRHVESPFYNSAVLEHLTEINDTKVNVFGLPPENLRVNRTINYDNLLFRLDHSFSERQVL